MLLCSHHWFRLHLFTVVAALSLGTACAPATAKATRLTSQQCQTMQQRNTISTANPVPCKRLMQVSFSYIDFAGKRHEDGLIVVLDALAPQVQKIFDELLVLSFPLQQAKPLESYQGDDQAAMQANNTSAFNGRQLTGGSRWSIHAYGAAIDINPRQNPYLSKNTDTHTTLLPPTAGDYVRRTPLRPGMAESIRDIFFKHGFLIWGGHWHQPIDYQHFEIASRTFIMQLLTLPPQAARAAFQSYVDSYATCLADKDSALQARHHDICAAQSRR